MSSFAGRKFLQLLRKIRDSEVQINFGSDACREVAQAHENGFYGSAARSG
jgi:hypothetical protein